MARSLHLCRANGYLKDWVADIGEQFSLMNCWRRLKRRNWPAIGASQSAIGFGQGQPSSRTDHRRAVAGVVENGIGDRAGSRRKGGRSRNCAASVDADQADVRRCKSWFLFQRVTAPFAGTSPSARWDIGDLIVAGSGGRNCSICPNRKLRVYVRVPEPYAPGIEPGQTATLTTPASPGRSFTAKVTTTRKPFQPFPVHC